MLKITKKEPWFLMCHPLKEKNQAKFFLVLFCIYDFSETTKFIMGFLKGFNVEASKI